jgi:biopolymer transport protein ExbD
LKLRQKQRQDPDISLTPLIDVVFLLLIFFMVSTSFTRESEINIDLPESTAQTIESEQTPVDLTIDSQGRFFINGKKVINTQLNTLVKALKLVIKKPEDVALIVSADGQTPHQAVVTAMDAARLLGVTRLSIATKQSAGQNKAQTLSPGSE